jgi:hypothetical protein
MNKRFLILLVFVCILLSYSHAEPHIEPHEIPPIKLYNDWPDHSMAPVFMYWDYSEYLSFFSKSLPSALPQLLSTYSQNEKAYAIILANEVIAYREDIRSGEKELTVPFLQDAPIALQKKEGIPAILVRDSNGYNGLFHIRFDCDHTGEFVEVTLSELPEEYLVYASQMNCSEFLKALWPVHANLHNYRRCGYNDAAAEIINVGGKPTSVLYLHERDGDEVFHLILDGYWVKIRAADGVLTDDFFENFGLGVLAEDFV